MELIFNNYGIEIFRENDKYFIRMDSGELVSRTLEFEVSKEEAEKAHLGEKEAYEVCMKHPNPNPIRYKNKVLPEEIRRKIMEGFKK